MTRSDFSVWIKIFSVLVAASCLLANSITGTYPVDIVAVRCRDSSFHSSQFLLPSDDSHSVLGPLHADVGPVPPSDRDFLINGWRWHSRSVLRDVRRFQEVATRERQEVLRGVEGSR